MKWLALVSLIAANLVRIPTPVVKITSGLVRGRVSENGKFYEYLGIPYGTVDDSNRFQVSFSNFNVTFKSSWSKYVVIFHVTKSRFLIKYFLYNK